jgi:replicative DNA helicase
MLRATAVADWIDSGVQPAFRVRTRSGREVEVTGHHPFLTVQGWVPLHDLAVGDAIAVPVAVPAFGHDETWPVALVRLLAHFIAAGDLTASSPRLTTGDPRIAADFQASLAACFPTCTVREDADGGTYEAMPDGGDRSAAQAGHPVWHWLAPLGLRGKQAHDMSFPDCAWRWSKPLLAEFVTVLASCRGPVSTSSSSGSPRIVCSLRSSRLAVDMQHALIRFGIASSCTQTAPGAWSVAVTEPEALRRFRAEIGRIGEQATRIVASARTARAQASGGSAAAAGAIVLVADAVQVDTGVTVGHPSHRARESASVASGARGLVPAAVAIAPCDLEAEPIGLVTASTPRSVAAVERHLVARRAEVHVYATPKPPASPAISWDPIVAIDPIGDQQVYDLTVPDGANFVAQDVLVHNTALALSLAHNSALRFGHRIAIFSLEMSKEQLVSRLLSMDAMVDQQRLRTGWIDDDEWQRISESVGRLSQANIYIDDTAGIPLVEMRSKARRLMLDRGFDLLIVDYLQLMQGSGAPGKGENRQQEISEISRGLKGLARELNVPVLALSQLSRAVESRSDKKPQLSDLRESGSIEQDSDVVMFIYRDEVYNPETDRKNIADIIVAKHRNGPVGQISLFFQAAQTRYRDLDLRTADDY